MKHEKRNKEKGPFHWKVSKRALKGDRTIVRLNVWFNVKKSIPIDQQSIVYDQNFKVGVLKTLKTFSCLKSKDDRKKSSRKSISNFTQTRACSMKPFIRVSTTNIVRITPKYSAIALVFVSKRLVNNQWLITNSISYRWRLPISYCSSLSCSCTSHIVRQCSES